MIHISSPIVLFLMGRSRTFLEIRIIFIWGGKKEGVRGVKKTKMRVIFAIPLIKQDANFISQTVGSDKLLITTIAIGIPKNLYAGNLEWFWAVLPGQKQLCVFLRYKYGFQIGNAIETINSIFTRKKQEMLWKKYSVLVLSQQREALSLSFPTSYACD